MNDKDMMFRLLYVAITRVSNHIKILLPNDFDESLVQYQENLIDSLEDHFKMSSAKVKYTSSAK
mgnify:CR=1 FL=1